MHSFLISIVILSNASGSSTITKACIHGFFQLNGILWSLSVLHFCSEPNSTARSVILLRNIVKVIHRYHPMNHHTGTRCSDHLPSIPFVN
ncbi:uncharacterized protein EDB91DRAFT_697640 [Suillus paluster]|uniref:uncharacterized protein n=1 Tax=Suillus paluster TaxID=48578 RepID=UPI001B86A003|nr:uncharacterized protein EDB91DRAFT_697640 [Suillus paluster]KAG1750569.1 hypothetical protein EDB91DRAFT_697640 [Suillus paluster]